ncbi:NAD(P)H-hydrate dehydratase [Loigolactobacillus binensis]|uniref:ADP-dependent (S)-NAD(P)H-hydrate dehydratase n=1 Tax=Loigolactobacillus binensis TaxID=2559922 RepID=A0ABW3EDG8_9LACO|nr:NAD(P)H-hydrate dehydratase [Loigolactobacillus binensis]
MQQITETLVRQVIQPRTQESHKGSFGRVLTIGGNRNFGGAIIMSASAAVYSGAGLVTCATDPQNFVSLHARLPEAMVVDYQDQDLLSTLIAQMDTVVIGPGLGTDATALEILKFVFTQVRPQQDLIVDGSAITLIAQYHLPLPVAQIVFTPHQMEWQRLSGLKIAAQTPANNQAVQQKLGATVIVKSHRTEVYLAAQSTIWQNTVGSAAMATGGMGDCLTGILAGFLAQFSADRGRTILAAVYTHSAISDQLARTQYVTLPTQIIAALPTFMAQLAS